MNMVDATIGQHQQSPHHLSSNRCSAPSLLHARSGQVRHYHSRHYYGL